MSTDTLSADRQRLGAAEPDLPRWVSYCWPKTWRDHYGEEMTQAWLDSGASRRSLALLAVHGLRHRVVRPVAAASVDSAVGRPGHDIAVALHPRYLLIALIAAVTAAAVTAAEIGLGTALSTSPAPSDRDRSAVLSAVIDDLLMALLLGLPWLVGVWGGVRTRRPRQRDVGAGLLAGAAMGALLVFVVPAIVAAVTS